MNDDSTYEFKIPKHLARGMLSMLNVTHVMIQGEFLKYEVLREKGIILTEEQREHYEVLQQFARDFQDITKVIEEGMYPGESEQDPEPSQPASNLRLIKTDNKKES